MAISASQVSWLQPTPVRLVQGEGCRQGHPVEDLICAYCGQVRYVGSLCQHVAPAQVVRRRWDNLPLGLDCAAACAEIAAPGLTVDDHRAALKSKRPPISGGR